MGQSGQTSRQKGATMLAQIDSSAGPGADYVEPLAFGLQNACAWMSEFEWPNL